MGNGSVEERVKTVIINTLLADKEKITRDAEFAKDLEADSLSVTELIMAFEEEFKIEIPDKEAENIKTVGDAVKYIEDHLPKED